MRSLKNRLAAGVTAAALVAGSPFGTGAIALADGTIPDAPTEVSIAPEGTTEGPVILTWTGPTNETITRYQIFRYKGDPEHRSADVFTYLDWEAGTEDTFFDNVPSDGIYWYAVVAVDDDGQASQPSEWVSVLVDIDGDGLTEEDQDNAAPPAPVGLNLGGGYTQSRTVNLTWDEQADVWRFLVFRADNGGTRQMIGYVHGEDNQFSETLNADGTYTYYLMAQDATGNVSPYSTGQRNVVDTVAPVVTITSPDSGQTYTGTGRLTVTAAVYEEGSGYPAANIDYYLDDEELASPYIDLDELADGGHIVAVTVTDRAGNVGSAQVLFVVDNNREEDPDAPRNLTVPQYTKSRAVTVRWSAPEAAGVSSYLIYRTAPGQTALLVGTTRASARTFTDTVPADGLYTYHVTARYTGGAEVESLPATTRVDTVAPVISIIAPENEAYTTADEFIAIDVDLFDANSGVAADGTTYYLDRYRFTGTEIDLADLEDGTHTFRVEATDRAGNKAIKSVTFTLNGAGNGGDDDEEDDGDGRPARNGELLSLLDTLKGEISAGHHAALSAFARNGNMKAFRHHLITFGNTRFISEEATRLLLEALGDDNSTPGKAKGRGRNR